MDRATERYITKLQALDNLTLDEERTLGAASRGGCSKSRERLISSHLKLAARVAMDYRWSGIPVDDLVADATMGLIRAVDKFDPKHGARLATYATYWMRAVIWERVRSQRSLVRVADHRTHPDRPQVSDMSLNVPGESGEERIAELICYEPSPEQIVMQQSQHAYQRRLLERFMRRLTPRQRIIVTRRLLSETPPTLDVLGAEFGVSKEAIRQQEAKGWEKMREAAGATR